MQTISKHGVQEYYFYDLDTNKLLIWMREGEHFREMENSNNLANSTNGYSFYA